MEHNIRHFIYLLSLSVGLVSTGFIHPFYVSISQINYNESKESLEITMKIFVEDLLQTIESTKGTKLYLGEEKELPQADSIIQQYILEHFDVQVNDQSIELNFLGRELENDVLWCYLEGFEVSNISTMNIKNSMLMEHFYTQMNIVHVNTGKSKKSVLLNKDRKADDLSFKEAVR